MGLNGQTLKIAFLMIVGTLCFILCAITIGFAFKIIPLNEFEQLLGVLGIIGIFSGIVQAFIHADFNKDGIPDIQQENKGEIK